VLPVGEDDALMPSLLTLSDVMGTGHHAAVVARVAPSKRAAVVGDGAVGLCGVIAAKRPGAEQSCDDSGSPVTWGDHVSDDEYNATGSAG
jgi:threonine dehydrogenase-like Zn-dependent dehydrogenase